MEIETVHHHKLRDITFGRKTLLQYQQTRELGATFIDENINHINCIHINCGKAKSTLSVKKKNMYLES